MERVEGLVEGALTLLVEARRISTEARRISTEALNDDSTFDDDAQRRLGVAITATHTVLEAPLIPTDELRAMGLWWGDGEGGIVLTREEAVALREYIHGDSHVVDVNLIDAFMAKVGEG